jgi:hypothetical protein
MLTKIPDIGKYGYLKKLYIYGASDGAIIRIHGTEIARLKNIDGVACIDFVNLIKMAHAREYFGRLMGRAHVAIDKMWGYDTEITNLYQTIQGNINRKTADTLLMLTNDLPIDKSDVTNNDNFKGLNCAQFTDMTIEDHSVNITFDYEYAA